MLRMKLYVDPGGAVTMETSDTAELGRAASLASLLPLITAYHLAPGHRRERATGPAGLSPGSLGPAHQVEPALFWPCFPSVIFGTSFLGETGKEKRVEVLFAITESLLQLSLHPSPYPDTLGFVGGNKHREGKHGALKLGKQEL